MKTLTAKKNFFYVKGAYEKDRKKLISYNEVHNAILDTLPFAQNKKINVLDLGCGTGETTACILTKYPHAQVTAIDLFEEMIKQAKEKLKKFEKQVKFVQGNFVEIKFEKKFDAIVSSLATHHLSHADKKKLFKKCFKHLKHKGIFVNGDLAKHKNPHLQKIAMEHSETQMRKKITDPKKIKDWFYHQRKLNNPAILEEQLKWMEKAGFKKISIVYRHYTKAVVAGYK
jgi:tRNA (cmo5U34)-methyltransferase